MRRSTLLTPVELKPLIAGSYSTSQAMWQAFVPVAAFVSKIVSKHVPRPERDAVAMDVWHGLAERAERHGGLTCEAPEHKQIAWFSRVVTNAVKDLVAKERRRAANVARAEVPPLDAPSDDEPVLQPDALWDPLEQDACPPNYRLALKAWYCATRLAQRDVEALAERSQRGKVDQKSGLVRPAAPAWALLRQLKRDWPDGVSRRRPGIDRFAFAVRSDATDFAAWVAAKKVASAEREAVGKWQVRGRRWLAERVKR